MLRKRHATVPITSIDRVVSDVIHATAHDPSTGCVAAATGRGELEVKLGNAELRPFVGVVPRPSTARICHAAWGLGAARPSDMLRLREEAAACTLSGQCTREAAKRSAWVAAGGEARVRGWENFAGAPHRRAEDH